MKMTVIKNNISILFVILILLQIMIVLYFGRIKNEICSISDKIMKNEVFSIISDLRETNLTKKYEIQQENRQFFQLPSFWPFDLKANNYQTIGSEVGRTANRNHKKNDRLDQAKMSLTKTGSFFYYSALSVSDNLLLSKDGFLEVSKKYMSVSHFDLVKGMLFGDISSMDKDFKHNLKVIGMLHVVSASGYNVSLLLGVLSIFFKKIFSGVGWMFFALGSVFFYTLLAGAQPSIIRASIMTSINLICSFVFRRQRRPLRILAITVIIMLLFNISYLESISFQLSVLATMGIILSFSRGDAQKNTTLSVMYGEILALEGNSTRHLSKSAVLLIFKDSLLVTLSAQVLVWPVLLLHFGEFNLVSLVANTFLLWLTPLITIFGMIFVVFGWLVGGGLFSFGDLIVRMLYFFLWLVIYIFETATQFFSKFGWMNYETVLRPSWPLIFLYWGLVLVFFKIKQYICNKYAKASI